MRRRRHELSRCIKSTKILKIKRRLEDPETRQKRLALNRERIAYKRSIETEEARNKRLAKDRERLAKIKKHLEQVARSSRFKEVIKGREIEKARLLKLAIERKAEKEARILELSKNNECRAELRTEELRILANIQKWHDVATAGQKLEALNVIQQFKAAVKSENNLLIEQDSILRDVNKYDTQQVYSDVQPQCDPGNIQEDPLSLPGPSYESGGMENIKVEFDEYEYKLDFEETETKMQHFGSIKLEVKEEPDEDQQETSSMYENVQSENPEMESVPGELAAVKFEETKTSASRAKRRRS